MEATKLSIDGFTSVLNQAAAEYIDLLRSHAELDEQLYANGLQTVNVNGGGSCLIRVVSYLLRISDDAVYVTL